MHRFMRGLSLTMIWSNALAAVINAMHWLVADDNTAILGMLFNGYMAWLLYRQLVTYPALQKEQRSC